MLISHPPNFLRRIYSSLVWDIPNHAKEVYLTFDDGPTAEVTEQVLDLLNRYQAKATFFCLGKNVALHPQLFSRIVMEGHQIGNHSYNHLDGWRSNNSIYLKDIFKASGLISSNLFRPPYGKINSTQIKRLRKTYKIIMWSILSRDYDSRISKEKCLEISTTNVKPGAIIVFHDSLKAKKNMLYALEGVLRYCEVNKLKCASIKLT